jgi:hypothetical protein
MRGKAQGLTEEWESKNGDGRVDSLIATGTTIARSLWLKAFP